MEYVQERIATLHDFGSAAPTGPVDRTTVVIPMMARDHATLAAERVFTALASLDPAAVVLALRAPPDRVGYVTAWLDQFDVDIEVCWCTAPAVERILSEAGLDGPAGKGRDVWLGVGQALSTEYVAVHDADATSYDPSVLHRLTFPLAHGFTFSKGYYARIENDRLYGRLCRLFVLPLLATLANRHDSSLTDFLAAFRYPLAGEFATTTTLAARLRAQRGWGLELDTLGQAHNLAGSSQTAQVDLGVHEHEHRAVTGPDGLGEMAGEVGASLFRVIDAGGIDVDYAGVAADYREAAMTLVDRYAVDAAFNGLAYDRDDERKQVARYATSIAPPGPDDRLPAWDDAPIEPQAIAEASRDALVDVTER